MLYSYYIGIYDYYKPPFSVPEVICVSRNSATGRRRRRLHKKFSVSIVCVGAAALATRQNVITCD